MQIENAGRLLPQGATAMAFVPASRFRIAKRENQNRQMAGFLLGNRKISGRPFSFETLKRQPGLLFRKFQIVRCAITHPGVPWYARLVAVLSVCYVFSPIQLIPSFIPVIGQLDDALVVTLGFKALTKWVPPGVLEPVERRPKASLHQLCTHFGQLSYRGL